MSLQPARDIAPTRGAEWPKSRLFYRDEAIFTLLPRTDDDEEEDFTDTCSNEEGSA